MAIAKRIALFLLTNILIMVSISIVWMVVTQVFGIGAIRGADGLQYGPLMIYCLIWGFMGSFISLALSPAGSADYALAGQSPPRDAVS